MNPDSEFTPAMLPSLARTRPSSGVRRNRLLSDPTCPDCGSAARNVAARGCARMKRRILVNAAGLTRLPLERPDPSDSENSVESTRTESIRNRRSTESPSVHDPPRPNWRPSCLRTISANQFWLRLRIGKIHSRSGRDVISASGGVLRAGR